MLGQFYTNCALITRNIRGEEELISENSQVTHLESENNFSVISPSTFVSGAEVIITGNINREPITGTIVSVDGRNADVATNHNEKYLITRYPIENLSMLSSVKKTKIVMNGFLTERVEELCWQGKGVLDVDNGKLSFYVRLINATPTPLTFEKVIISDTSYGGDVSRAMYPMSRMVTSQVTSPQGENEFKSETYDLGGPYTVETMTSVKVWEQNIGSATGLYYDLIQGSNHIFVHCEYTGEIYSGNYTVKIDSLNLRRNVYINPTAKKIIEVQLPNRHAPYSVDVNAVERNENGFTYVLTIKNNNNGDIPLNIFVYKQSGYLYTPLESVVDTGSTIAWVIRLKRNESRKVTLRAIRIRDEVAIPSLKSVPSIPTISERVQE